MDESWLYLKILSGAMLELVQYYFTLWAAYHKAIKAAAIAIIFSAGLAWMGLQVLRSPFDKLRGLLGVMVVLTACGIVLSSSDRSSGMYLGNSQNGTPVANGTYWSFALVGGFYKTFKSAIDSVFDAELGDAYGGIGGPQREAMMIAYDDTATKNAKAFEGTPAHAVYLDYMANCNTAALKSFGTNSKTEALKGVGLLNSSRIAIDERDTSVLAATATRTKELSGQYIEAIYSSMGPSDYWITDKFKAAAAQIVGGVTAGAIGAYEGGYNGSKIAEQKAAGEEALRAIPAENNPYDGKTVGYRIPTKAYFDKLKGIENSSPEFYSAETDLGGRFVQKGYANDVPVAPGDETQATQLFYPKNCSDAYELASEAIKAWRDSNADDPKFEGSQVAGAHMSLSAAQQMSERAQGIVEERIKAAGGKDIDLGSSDGFNDAADNIYAVGLEVSAQISEWMLRYKVPMTITTMAMVAAGLLITFPMFCAMAVFLGSGILWTYLKLLVFTFLVVFINDLFLGMAASAIAGNAISASSDAGYIPGSGSLAADMAASYTKAIVFSALTVLEIVVAKLLLWDDVKSLGGFNPGSMGTSSAAGGLQAIGSAALAVATLGKGLVAAKAAGAVSGAGASKVLGAGAKAMSYASKGLSSSTSMSQTVNTTYRTATTAASAFKGLVPKPPAVKQDGDGKKGKP